MLVLRRPDGSEWQLSEIDLTVMGGHTSVWLQLLPASLTIQGREFFLCAFPDGAEIALAYACPDFWPPLIGPTAQPGEYGLLSRDRFPPTRAAVRAAVENAALSIEDHIRERLRREHPASVREASPCA
jgi:hypothetical protein